MARIGGQTAFVFTGGGSLGAILSDGQIPFRYSIRSCFWASLSFRSNSVS
jgi:hypothetical protein